MNRFKTLILFELKKILTRKKAILFLLALNVVPILASLMAILIYAKLKTFGLGIFQFSLLVKGIMFLFTGHIKLFALISPFFLALVIGDSFSGESGRGYLKTLLLTPVARWQVVFAKAFSVMIFLLIAVALGGLFLQIDLWVAKSMSESSSIIMDIKPDSAFLIDTPTAFRILALTFISNLALIGYFILFSLFSESPILMAFTSLIVLMSLQTYVLMAPYLGKLDVKYEKIAEWCFTRHLSDLSEISTIHGILERNIYLTSSIVYDPIKSSLGWALFFFIGALFFFQRKQILN